MARTVYTEVAGRRICYRTAGDSGPSLVLLHGGSFDSSRLSWNLQIETMSKWAKVIAPDFPGFGESEPVSGPCTRNLLVEFAEAFLDRLQLKTVTLAGLSLGGLVATALALKRKDLVSRLILVAPAGLTSEIGFARLASLSSRYGRLYPAVMGLLTSHRRLLCFGLKSVIHDREAITGELVDEVWRATQTPGAGLAWRSFLREEIGRHGFRKPLLEHLKGISCPVLLLQGRYDRIIPAPAVVEAVQRFPSAQLKLLDCGHWVTRERPAECQALIWKFLEETSASAAAAVDPARNL